MNGCLLVSITRARKGSELGQLCLELRPADVAGRRC